LTQVPHVAKLGYESLMQIVSVARPADEEAQDGEFGRERTAVLAFRSPGTHRVSIPANGEGLQGRRKRLRGNAGWLCYTAERRADP